MRDHSPIPRVMIKPTYKCQTKTQNLKILVHNLRVLGKIKSVSSIGKISYLKKWELPVFCFSWDSFPPVDCPIQLWWWPFAPSYCIFFRPIWFLPNGVLLFSEEIFRGVQRSWALGSWEEWWAEVVIGTYCMKAESVFNLKNERDKERKNIMDLCL